MRPATQHNIAQINLQNNRVCPTKIVHGGNTRAINTDIQISMHKMDLDQDDFARLEHPTVTGAARIIQDPYVAER